MGPWDCKQFWNDLTFEFDLMPTPVGPAEGAKSTSWVGSVAYAVSAKSINKWGRFNSNTTYARKSQIIC